MYLARASIGNLGGWQVARTLFFLNVLTGSVGNKGGTQANEWNKFVPKPFASPPAFDAWNELQLPHEWPLAHYELSFLLPHFLEEGRGDDRCLLHPRLQPAVDQPRRLHVDQGAARRERRSAATSR